MPTVRPLQKPLRWPDLWFRTPRHVLLSKMPLSPPPPLTPPDPFTLLPDAVLLRILALLPPLPTSLVCRRFLLLLSRLQPSLTLLHFPSLPLLPSRFPNLSSLNLVPASFLPSPSPILLTHSSFSLSLSPAVFPGDSSFYPSESLTDAAELVAKSLPSLTFLSLVADVSDVALLNVAEGCPILQELHLYRCSDNALRAVSAFSNLQILKIVAGIEGVYSGPGVTDIGLTIVAHGCKRLVRLELWGCEGSYDGISAVGRCCVMLEELTLFDHRLDGGWMAGLSYCRNLKTLRMVGCRRIDDDPGPVEHLGSCPTIERIHLQRCQLRDKRSLTALFKVCDAVRDIVLQNCWGLDDEMFHVMGICRRVKFLCLEGCSLLTTEGLESVVLLWNDLQHLSVVSCNKIKDSEVSPALSSHFALLKELKWCPDSRSVLTAGLQGTGMGKKGGRFFKRT